MTSSLFLSLSRAAALPAVVAACALGACSGTSTGGPGPKDTGAKPDVVTDDPGTLPCADPSMGPTCVMEVRVKVVDTAGAPISGLLVTVCGSICYNGKDAAGGNYVVQIWDYIDPKSYAILVHGRESGYASVDVALPPVDKDKNIIVADPVRIPKLPVEGPLLVKDDGNTPAADSVTSGDLTLRFPGGTYVDLDLVDSSLSLPGVPKWGLKFLYAKVDSAKSPPFAKDSKAKSFYALGPYSAKFQDASDRTKPKKVGVEMLNTDGLKAGIAVEFLAMGDEVVRKPFTGGLLQVVATGKVSTDGTKITTDLGEGLTYLTWLGVRAK